MWRDNMYMLNMDAVKMSDDEFFQFCHDNRPLRIERDENQQIIIMSPTGSLTGYLNNIVSSELYHWNKQTKLGKTFDSSTGFTLADGSKRSPDASWVSIEKWDALTLQEKQKFAPVCPEFVVELKSTNDSIEYLQKKIQNVWIKNGTVLAWLIDPDQEQVYIYKRDGSQEVISGFDQKLTADDLLVGFKIDLQELRTH